MPHSSASRPVSATPSLQHSAFLPVRPWDSSVHRATTFRDALATRGQDPAHIPSTFSHVRERGTLAHSSIHTKQSCQVGVDFENHLARSNVVVIDAVRTCRYTILQLKRLSAITSPMDHTMFFSRRKPHSWYWFANWSLLFCGFIYLVALFFMRSAGKESRARKVKPGWGMGPDSLFV